MKKFQSTLPAGEATLIFTDEEVQDLNFNPRFPRGKRLLQSLIGKGIAVISIHASRGGSDLPVPDPDF